MSCEPLISLNNLTKVYSRSSPISILLGKLFRSSYFEENFFVALKNLSFEVERGKCIGIVGRNGSGKSTLLRIIAGTIPQTSGQIFVRGSVHALLELGASFSPDMTGRENAKITLLMLGCSPKYSDELINEILEFSEIGDFFDQPVKTYSNGMFMRLAFSVNTAVYPEILIVDEALSVGDTPFQIKCFSRMKEMKKFGTTILFVSHDLQSVRSFCDDVLWLDKGCIAGYGPTFDVLNNYSKFLSESDIVINCDIACGGAQEPTNLDDKDSNISKINLVRDISRGDFGSGEYRLRSLSISGAFEGASFTVNHLDHIRVIVDVDVLVAILDASLGVSIAFLNKNSLNIVNFTSRDNLLAISLNNNQKSFAISFDFINVLAPGEYVLAVAVDGLLEGGSLHYYDFIRNAALITVTANKTIHSLVAPDCSIAILHS